MFKILGTASKPNRRLTDGSVRFRAVAIKKSSLSSLDCPILVKTCKHAAQTLKKELQMTLQTADVSICNDGMIYLFGTSSFHTKVCIQAFPCFYCFLLTLEIQNTICYSLITLSTRNWQNFNQIKIIPTTRSSELFDENS